MIEYIDFLKFELTNIGSDLGNVDLFALTQTLKHECKINSLFEAWELFWKHQQVVYQLLVTYHENFGEKYLWFLQVLRFVETIFQKKYYQEPFMNINEVGNFDCFDVRSLCDIKVEKMDWKVVFEMWHNMNVFLKSYFLD